MTWMSLTLSALLWTLHALPPVEMTPVETAAGEGACGAIRLTVSGVEQDSPFAAARGE
ncbi:MAG: hypothetical protein U0939_18025 [Pirellulales bacterium]